MKTGFGLVALLVAACSLVPCRAQTVQDDERAIISVIRNAYIGGVYNDPDTAAMKDGFHDAMTVQELHGGQLIVQPLKQWRIEVERQKLLGLRSTTRTAVDITVIGLAGQAAVARVDSSNDNVRDLTDFLSLYKFPDGWRITNRIVARHPLPPDLARQRYLERENAVTQTLQPPERVMEAAGIKAGMVVGEIGAGRGRYTVHLARRVGSAGKILANDINDAALSYIRERCQRDDIGNIETILGKEDDPRFPAQSLDAAFMVWVYHTFESAPVALLKNLKKSLKPGAPLVIVEPIDSEINQELEAAGVSLSSRDTDRPATITEKIKKEAGEAGFELLRVETFLPLDYIFVLRSR